MDISLSKDISGMSNSNQVAEKQVSPALDLSIEGMSSQQFSIGVFWFMTVGIVVFSAILYFFLKSSKGTKMKTGEKVMFGGIILGVIVAVVFAATQMVFDYLF